MGCGAEGALGRRNNNPGPRSWPGPEVLPSHIHKARSLEKPADVHFGASHCWHDHLSVCSGWIALAKIADVAEWATLWQRAIDRKAAAEVVAFVTEEEEANSSTRLMSTGLELSRGATTRLRAST